MRFPDRLLDRARRRLSVRGDTYGVVCALIFVIFISLGIVTFRLVSAKPVTIAEPPEETTGYALTANPALSPTAPPVRTGDDAALNLAMKNSSRLGGSHLVSRGLIAPSGGGFRAQFQYEKRDVLEKIHVNDGAFARQGSGTWVRGEEWSANAPAVTKEEASFLDDLVKIIHSPWDVAAGSAPARCFPGVKRIVYAKGVEGGEEQLFSFRRTSEQLCLERFAGPLRSGGDEVDVTLAFDYPDFPIPPESETTPTVRRALPVATSTPKRQSATRKRVTSDLR